MTSMEFFRCSTYCHLLFHQQEAVSQSWNDACCFWDIHFYQPVNNVTYLMILAAEVEGQAPEESSSPNTSTSNANEVKEGATDHPVSSSKLRFPRFLRRTHSASYANPRDVPPYALFLRAKRVTMFLFQIARSSADRLDRLRRIFSIRTVRTPTGTRRHR